MKRATLSFAFKFLFVFGMVGVLASTASADLVTNGSFETPVVPVGAFTNFTVGSTAITGWTVVGPEVSIVNTDFTQLGFSFPAEDRNQWLDLTGDGSNSDSEGVEQTIATTPGATYDLSYFVGNVVGGGFGTTSTVNVLIDSLPFATSTNSGGGTTLTWEHFSSSFTASSSTTLIEFLNGDPPTDNSNGLDNVSVVPAAAVPEPSTLTMCSLALIGCFGFGRLRSAYRR